MVWFVKLMGIILVVFGAIYFVKPNAIKKSVRFWVKDKRIYFGAILNLLIGVIFLVTASKCTIPWIVVIVGIWSLLKGILAFALGPKKINFIVEKLTEGSVKTLRIFAVIALILGTLLIYSA